MKLHTILGAGGAVANSLVPLLLAHQEKVRLVSRTPQPVEGAECVAADLNFYSQVQSVVEGSSVVYLLAGLKYDVREWQKSWPAIMTNVIEACRQTGAALIFFDNVYMYGPVKGVMTEETPFRPTAKKGKVRASVAEQLLSEMREGRVRALIARSADFYGPGAYKSGMPNLLVFDRLRHGKKAQWLGNADMPHSFTYVPDAARALYMLAGREEAFGQTWHLPTAAGPLTGRQFIAHAARELGKDASFSVLPTFMLRAVGLFNRTVGELAEMNYQYTAPYLFSSDKFNQAFNYAPISYEEGIRESLQDR